MKLTLYLLSALKEPVHIDYKNVYSGSGMHLRIPGVVACICNPATLEAKFWNDVGSISGWIVLPPVIQH